MYHIYGTKWPKNIRVNIYCLFFSPMWKVCRSTFTIMSYIFIHLILDSLLLLCMKIGSMHTNMICMTYVISVRRYRSGKKGIGGPVYVHYRNVIMSAMVSEIIGVSVVCTIVCSGADQRKIKVPRHWPWNGSCVYCALVIAPRGETTHEGVDVNNTPLSMINPDYNMMPAISVRINQYSAYYKQIKAWIESNRRRRSHVTT